VALFGEPKSKKRSVYAEPVASFGKFHVFKHVNLTLNNSRTMTSITYWSNFFCGNDHFAPSAGFYFPVRHGRHSPIFRSDLVGFGWIWLDLVGFGLPRRSPLAKAGLIRLDLVGQPLQPVTRHPSRPSLTMLDR
jgi:hypothetical protein